jgi:hypothetical protein
MDVLRLDRSSHQALSEKMLNSAIVAELRKKTCKPHQSLVITVSGNADGKAIPGTCSASPPLPLRLSLTKYASIRQVRKIIIVFKERGFPYNKIHAGNGRIMRPWKLMR